MRSPHRHALLLIGRGTCIALLAVVLFCPHLGAALVFDHPEQRVAPKIADTQVRLGYHFTNSGTESVTITNIAPSCSCTAAALAKATYKPGEGGVIDVTFTIGARMGTQSKTITVSTSDPKQPTTVLTLDVDIPEQATFSHRVMTWMLGEKPDAKSVTMTMPGTLAMQVLRVGPHDQHGPACTASVAAVEAGRSYTITCAPVTTDHLGTTTIDVVTNLKTYHLYVRVRVAPAAVRLPTAPSPGTPPTSASGAPAPRPSP